MMDAWRALVRAVSGKPDVTPANGIPAGVENTISFLRDQRRDADQQTRQLRDIARRNDPAAALRLARQRREASP